MSLDGFKTHSKRILDHLEAKTFSRAIVFRRRYIMRWQADKTKELTCFVVPVEVRFDGGTRNHQGRRYLIGVYLLQSFSDADTESQELDKHDSLNKVLDEVETALEELRDQDYPTIISSEVPREAIDFEVDDVMVFFAGVVLEVVEV